MVMMVTIIARDAKYVNLSERKIHCSEQFV
jgi:hypothetical protein